MTADLSEAMWRKSSHSGANNDCVEVAGIPAGAVAIRDSKDRGGAVLVVLRKDWDIFLAGVKGGEFDHR